MVQVFFPLLPPTLLALCVSFYDPTVKNPYTSSCILSLSLFCFFLSPYPPLGTLSLLVLCRQEN
jgi:hypothetical protein